MRKFILVLAAVVMAFAGCAVAQTAADVVALAQKGVGEEVLAAFIETSNARFDLSVDDIIKLKEAKVSDKLIVAMLKHRPAQAAARPAAEPEAAQGPVIRRKEAPAVEREVPQERVVERERVIEVPSTTVVYRDTPTVVYSGYPSVAYSDWYYPSYGSYYPSYVSLGWGYGGGYGSSRYWSGSGSYHSSGYHGSSYPSNHRTGYAGTGYSSYRPQYSGGTHFGTGYNSYRPQYSGGTHSGTGYSSYRPVQSSSGGGGFRGGRR